MEIKRPRSALHAGDFDESNQRDPAQTVIETSHLCPDPEFLQSSNSGPLGTSPTTSWYKQPFREYVSPRNVFRERDYSTSQEELLGRGRAPSTSSFSSSFVLKAPTTPLVQQSSNVDFDSSSRDRSTSPDKSNRRHTLPPHILQSMHHTPVSNHRQQPHHWHSMQKESPFTPGHIARRSLTSNWSLQHSTSPPSSTLSRPRRTSFSSEASPLQHASMVGSYEESILRGRMSAAPSKPLNFTAQIGVLGKGDCKPKCPPHITVPFPAVYYCWSAGLGRRPVNDEPSPYVGQIDLHQSASSMNLSNSPTRKGSAASLDLRDNVPGRSENLVEERSRSHRDPARVRRRRRLSPSFAPPEGSYRIPEQGQLQIVIKNPNKTAVKLFLVPYDLSGMEPGTKTFIRQRLLSAGPIIENSLVPKMSPKVGLGDPNPKHSLRYLIHLNICCPSKGRYYLYQHIRVVFANRVPDNKEQLRTETQLPEPRFSTWKPVSLSRQASSSGSRLSVEKAFCRRSSGVGFGEDIRAPWASAGFSGGSSFPFYGDSAPPVPAIPFNLPSRTHSGATSEDRWTEPMDIDSSRPTTSSEIQSPHSNGPNCPGCMHTSTAPESPSSTGNGEYEKLNRGDAGYGGLFGRPSTPEPGRGLLAQKLQQLGAQRDMKPESDM